MQKLDHLKRGPKSHKISTIDILEPEYCPLISGIPLYAYQSKGIGAIRLEIVFDAGRHHEEKKLVAQSCAALITEGCDTMSSEEISESIDFEGAYLSCHGSSDFITIKMTCAKKSFDKVLPILQQVISSPTFAEEELESFVSRRKHKMAINLSKNDIISYRTITESLYGQGSVYGYNSTFQMLDDLEPGDLKNHYINKCVNSKASIFLSGDFGDAEITKIEELSRTVKSTQTNEKKYQPQINLKETIKLAGRENQSSLKIAFPLFNRNHEKYPGVYILNTILGGFFGSRLMKNIREAKGYTYNIYSMLDTYKHDGAMIVSCELDHSYVDDTLKQISVEFDKLKNDLVSDQELLMVKNYMLGNFLSTISGPFKAMNPKKMEVILGLEKSFYHNLSQKILAFRPEEIRSLAQEFLNIDKFWKVIVGKG